MTKNSHRAAITTAACCALDQTASSTFSSATTAGAVNFRICPVVQPRIVPVPSQPDDQFGGPEPDDAHLYRRHPAFESRRNDADGQSVLRRRSSDEQQVGSEHSEDLRLRFAQWFWHGLRSDFRRLWEQENGDDSFSELNRVEPGFNSGWVQIMGPPERIAQYKAIETSPENDPCLNTPYFGLQQLRWSPT